VTYSGNLLPDGPGKLRGELRDELGCIIPLTGTVVRENGSPTRIDLVGESVVIATDLLLPGEPGFAPSAEPPPAVRDPKRERYTQRLRRRRST
jgi:hypothetical protein